VLLFIQEVSVEKFTIKLLAIDLLQSIGETEKERFVIDRHVGGGPAKATLK